MKNILITGGAGFISHHLIYYLLKNTNCNLVSLDRLDYSGNLNRLEHILSGLSKQEKSRVKVVFHDLKADINPWLQKEISIEQFKAAFPSDFIAEHVQRFTMCGDVGDPIYCKDYLKIIEYIKDIKPTCHVYTITNGSYKTQS